MDPAGALASAEAYLLAALRLRAEAVLAEEAGKLHTAFLFHHATATSLERWLTALPARLSSSRYIGLCLVASDARGDAQRLMALLAAKKPLSPLPAGLVDATVAPLGATQDASAAFEVTLACKIAQMHVPPPSYPSLGPAMPSAEAILEPLAGIELLGRAIRIGAFLSPTVYAPADIWRQHNARIPGFNLKREGFLSLLQGLRRFSAVTAARTECVPVDVFMRELSMLLVVLDRLKATMQPLHDERQREAAARVRQRLERAAAASAAKATDIASRARASLKGTTATVTSRVGSVAWAISQGVRGGTFSGGTADSGAGGALPPRLPTLSSGAAAAAAAAPAAPSGGDGSEGDALGDSPLVAPSAGPPGAGEDGPSVLALFSDSAGDAGALAEEADSFLPVPGSAAAAGASGDAEEEEEDMDLGAGSMDVWGGAGLGGGSGASGGAATPARARGVSSVLGGAGGASSEAASPASIRGRLGTELGFGDDDAASLDGSGGVLGADSEDAARRRGSSVSSLPEVAVPSAGDAAAAAAAASHATSAAASSSSGASTGGPFGSLSSAPLAPAPAPPASKGGRLFSALKAKAMGVVSGASAPAPAPAPAPSSSSSSFSLLKRAQVAIKGVAASAAQALNLSSSAPVTASTAELVSYALLLAEICDLIAQLQAWVRCSLWGQALVMGQLDAPPTASGGEAAAEAAAYERWLHSCAAVWMVSHVRAAVLRVIAGLWTNFGSLATSDMGLLLNRHLGAHHEKVIKVKATM